MSPPPDPRASRFDRLALLLRISVAAAGVLAVGALLLGEDAVGPLGAAMVVVLVGTPLLRVAWFVQRWYRRGDRRYASVGLLVLAVVLGGALLV